MKPLQPLLKLLFKPTSFLVLLLIGVSATGGYSFVKYQKVKSELKRLQNPTETAKMEAKKLSEIVGKFMELPKEEPTIATVTDKEKLKDQLFFAMSENGDKVLIYTQAKKAILYRPSTNKIIDVAPVNIGATSTAGQPTPVRVVLRNGTVVVGVTKKYEEELKVKLTNVVVTAKENAKKQDYAKTLIVDLSGNKKAQADQIGQVLGATVSELPSGEDKPDADFLIIVGEDKK